MKGKKIFEWVLKCQINIKDIVIYISHETGGYSLPCKSHPSSVFQAEIILKIIPHLKSETSQHLGHIRCKGSKLCEKAAKPSNCQTPYSKTKKKKI